jgi:hypothetical protein
MAANALSRGTIDVSVIINSMGMVAEMGRLYCVRYDEVVDVEKWHWGSADLTGLRQRAGLQGSCYYSIFAIWSQVWNVRLTD